MTQILRRYIQVKHSGNWEDHLNEVQKMIAYVVSAGHRNYAACLPLYLNGMRELAVSAPDGRTEFMNGNFCVHCTPGSFNGVWTDLAHEQTYNRDGKTLMKGTTQNPVARQKYFKSAPFLTGVLERVKEMLHINTDTSSHHRESENSAIATDAKVNDIVDIVTNRMTDPFDLQHNEFVNIASGMIASSQDVLLAKERGITAMPEAEASGSYKIKIQKLLTFATQKQVRQHKSKQLAKVYQGESSVTRALYFVQGTNDTSKLNAFCHEWTEYHRSLFEPDHRSPQGYSMRKGNKADYLSALCSLNSEHNVSCTFSIRNSLWNRCHGVHPTV